MLPSPGSSGPGWPSFSCRRRGRRSCAACCYGVFTRGACPGVVVPARRFADQVVPVDRAHDHGRRVAAQARDAVRPATNLRPARPASVSPFSHASPCTARRPALHSLEEKDAAPLGMLGRTISRDSLDPWRGCGCCSVNSKPGHRPLVPRASPDPPVVARHFSISSMKSCAWAHVTRPPAGVAHRSVCTRRSLPT